MTKNTLITSNAEQLSNSTNQCPSKHLTDRNFEADEEHKISKNKRKARSFHWSPAEHQKYVNFLVEQRHLFDLESDKRRVIGIHVRMSKIIRNRSQTQCRSHHQKMLMKYGSIDNIIRQNRDLVCEKNLWSLTSKEQVSKQQVQQKISQQVNEFVSLISLGYFPQISCQQSFLETEMKEVESQQFELAPLLDLY